MTAVNDIACLLKRLKFACGGLIEVLSAPVLTWACDTCRQTVIK